MTWKTYNLGAINATVDQTKIHYIISGSTYTASIHSHINTGYSGGVQSYWYFSNINDQTKIYINDEGDYTLGPVSKTSRVNSSVLYVQVYTDNGIIENVVQAVIFHIAIKQLLQLAAKKQLVL